MAVLKSSLILSLIDNVSGPARRISGVMAGFQKQQLGMLSALRGAGGLLALGAGYIGVTQGIGATAGAAVEFEEAFANVRKVLNGSDEQLENIRRSIIGMSKDLPIAASGIAEIYAAAGQANIPIQEMNKFAEMVAKVSTAWDVPVAETGDALAKIKTQLNLGVTEVGLFADSLNHLANNTAANAPNLLEYTSRVAATGEMFGFSAQETLAFGGAMISAGAESEVAATSFRNMGRALTKGTEATKMQRTAYKRLGLDAVKTAKNMQKNALGTTLDVIEKIQELPEWERISMASALFGDEARALMPAINNSTELRRQLGLVGDQANYAGSAFNEYIIRANTTGNVLQILRNKFADLFRGIGDNMLPGIKEAALGVGDIIDSLGERAHVFAQMEAAFKGFAQGMGAEGGIRDMINDLGDLLFGAADGSAAADKIGRIFVKFKEWGAAVRELTTAIAANPLVKFFADLAPYGFQIMLWGAGIAMLAGTIRSLAKALFFLSGASTILAALKAVGSIAAIVGGGTAAGGAPPKGAPTTPGGTSSATARGGGLASVLRGVGAAALALGVVTTLGGKGEVRQLTDADQELMFNKRGQSPVTPTMPGISAFTALDNATRARAMGFGGSTDNLPGKTKDDIDIGVLRAAMAPQGVQQVMVTNPQAPNVTVHAPITITGVVDGSAAGSAAASQLGNEVKSAVESGYMDSR
jgi:TP901 family phage tail tape measure protein